MNKRNTLAIIMVLFVLFGHAQHRPDLAVNNIPDSLLKNSKSIVRKSIIEYTITSASTATKKVIKEITVLHPEYSDDLNFMEYENSFSELDNDTELSIFDGTGRLVRKVKKKEIQRVSANTGSTISDDYFLYAEMAIGQLPATVRIAYTKHYKGILELDDFITADYGRSIQQSSILIHSSLDNPIRFKNFRSNIAPTITLSDNNKTWFWEVKNVKNIFYEPGAPKYVVPRVRIAPTYFEMDGVGGSYASWNEFGKWSQQLISTQQQLTPQQIEELKQIAAGATSDQEKAQRLYDHLQTNFRYVSIQLGIGGWKPIAAKEVAEKKFGDCKGLTNYLASALGALGIQSHYALVASSNRAFPVDPSFPSNDFDHVILCIPFGKDTTWLECTSKDNAYGNLGTFTDDRYSLLITNNGGQLVRTPMESATVNTLSINTKISMNDDYSAHIVSTMTHTNEWDQKIKSLVWNSTPRQINQHLHRAFSFQTIDNLSVQKMKRSKAFGETIVEGDLEKVPQLIAGNLCFIPIQYYSFLDLSLPATFPRQMPYLYPHTAIIKDTIELQLPKGFAVKEIPENQQIQTEVLNAKISVVSSNQQLDRVIIVKELELKTYKIAPEQYNATAIAIQQWEKALENKIVAIKN